jgi:hypothetical protein
MKWNLMAALIYINFAENLTAITIMYYINGGDDTSFSDNSFIPEPTARSAVPGVSRGRGY